MIAHHRLEAGDPGHDALGPATVPGEEMGLDEAGDNPHVGYDQEPVQERGGTVAGRSELD